MRVDTFITIAETLLRLVQSVPSPKAEPIKLWLVKVGYERMKAWAEPSLSADGLTATRAEQAADLDGQKADCFSQIRLQGKGCR